MRAKVNSTFALSLKGDSKLIHGLSDEGTIKKLFVCFLILGFTVGVFLLHYLKKRGVNTNSGKIIVPLGLLALYIAFLPFYFDSNLDVKAKIIITIMGTVAGIGNYISVNRAGVIFRKTFGIKTKYEKQQKEEKKEPEKKQ